MIDQNTPPFPTKFKPGDWVKYNGDIWQIECFYKTPYEYGYELTQKSGSRNFGISVTIKEGDKRFTKA